jgi:hypothetical protein
VPGVSSSCGAAVGSRPAARADRFCHVAELCHQSGGVSFSIRLRLGRQAPAAVRASLLCETSARLSSGCTARSRDGTLVIVGGLSRYRGSEPNVDVSFDCGLGPAYRARLGGFRSARHTLSTASPCGSKSPCPLGYARRRFAGTPRHVGEMCLTDSSC